MLAKKLISNQITDEKKIENILKFMCSESGSHDYTINRREAKDGLGLRITKPTTQQYEIIKALYDDFSKELELTDVYNPQVYLGTLPQKDYSFRRGLIESAMHGSYVYISEGKLFRQAAPNSKITENIPTYEGWKYET
jgi:hypothetical protein